MSEWQDMQQKPNTKLRDLLKDKKAKTRNLSERCHKQINADAVGWWKDEVRL